MPHLLPLALDEMTEPSRRLAETAAHQTGFVPAVIRLLAHSPAGLEGYLGLRTAVQTLRVPARLREWIAIAIAAANGCDGCLSNHRRFGLAAGLSEAEMSAAERGEAADPAAAAALRFARALLESRGHVDPRVVEEVRAAGFTDEEIVEMIAIVALNFFANLVNNVGQGGVLVCDPGAPKVVGADGRSGAA